jgi:hypothetical protein
MSGRWLPPTPHVPTSSACTCTRPDDDEDEEDEEEEEDEDEEEEKWAWSSSSAATAACMSSCGNGTMAKSLCANGTTPNRSRLAAYSGVPASIQP